MNQPLISIVIEGYNESHAALATLPETLIALRKQQFNLKDVEIVSLGTPGQVDAWRADPSAFADFGSAKFVPIGGDDPHYWVMKNAGGDAATGVTIAFTDSDVWPEPQWLAAIQESIANGADASVGPSMFFGEKWKPYDTVTLAAGAVSWGFVFDTDDHGQWRAKSCAGHNIAVRRDMFQKVRFREGKRLSFMSSMFFADLKAAGAKVAFNPKQRVAHGFAPKWWLTKRHYRYGWERSSHMAMDPTHPGYRSKGVMRWLTPVPMAAWHSVQDVPRWLRYSRAVEVSNGRRMAMLPLVVGMSVAARGSEALGTYANLSDPDRKPDWATF